MDKATDDILKKIKKLMALGSSPSEAEAASALEKARVLLARHGLSLADVETRESEIVEGVLLEKKRLRSWEQYLIQVVAQCTFTQALTVQRGEIRQILIIGREINTRSAAELFAYLHKAVLILARAHSSRVEHLDSFRIGAVIRIGERLAELGEGTEEAGGPWAGGQRDKGGSRGNRAEAAGGTGSSGAVEADRQLTVRMAATAERENEAFIEGKYGKTRTKKVGRRVHGESYNRGLAAGDGVSLHRQIRQ